MITYRLVARRIVTWWMIMSMIVGVGLGTVAVSVGRADELPAAMPALTRDQAYGQAKALAEIGAKLFRDPRFSGSGKIACSSCHEPGNAFAPSNDRSVQLGGSDLRQAGLRAVPSLKYLQSVPQFTEHFFDSEDEADESVDNGPTGGLTWDGRADSKMDQARIPLLSSFEMGNRQPGDVVAQAENGGYLKELAEVLGPTAIKSQDAAFNAILLALQVYQEDPATFYPYDSKYDAYLAGKVQLNASESRGLAAFNDEQKGNCASCHISERGRDGTAPQFTDYGLIAIGLPRNMAIPANQDPNFFDLGLCGPLRTDLANKAEYCGLFRTPSLRNVATRHAFFHNGVFHKLRDAVAFYATRDSDPGHWYPHRADGSVDKFNDLPERYRSNLNADPPFDHPSAPVPARLSDADIDDIVAFLGTLTDGYRPTP
jgi:cytochrome c peroxidase